MKYSSAEIKSGILIVVSAVLLLVLTFLVGRFTTAETQQYEIRFGYAGGIEENAPVYFAGREAGKVKTIRILPGESRPILLTVELMTDVRLRKDSEANIDTLGLLGEKFVELTPGKTESPFLEPGSRLEGVDPIPTHHLIRKMSLLADRMDEMTLSLNPLIASVNGLLEGNKEDISKIVANLTESSANVRDLTHELKYRPWRLVRKG